MKDNTRYIVKRCEPSDLENALKYQKFGRGKLKSVLRVFGIYIKEVKI